MENAAVVVIVIAVTVYLIRRGILNHKRGTGCSSCTSCPWSGECAQAPDAHGEKDK